MAIDNPYIPGDPACYDLKWVVDKIMEADTDIEAVSTIANQALSRANTANNAAAAAQTTATNAGTAATAAQNRADAAYGLANDANTTAINAGTTAAAATPVIYQFGVAPDYSDVTSLSISTPEDIKQFMAKVEAHTAAIICGFYQNDNWLQHAPISCNYSWEYSGTAMFIYPQMIIATDIALTLVEFRIVIPNRAATNPTMTIGNIKHKSISFT